MNIDNSYSILDALIAVGDGTFTVQGIPLPPPPSTLGPPNSSIAGVAIGDLNGDGKPDATYLNVARVFQENSSGQLTGGEINTIQSSTGNGDGTFNSPTPAATLPVSQEALPVIGTLRVASVTSAARRDLVSLLPPSSTLTVTPSTGNGTFGTPVTVDSGQTFNDVVAADVNHDGKVDLVAAAFGAEVSVLDNATPGG